MIRVLHIVQSITEGGGARTVMTTARSSMRSGQFQHAAISLSPASHAGLAIAEKTGLSVIDNPEPKQLQQELEQADIVQVNYWNFPRLHALLHSELLPPMRLLIWFHIAGDSPPQAITRSLVDFADVALTSNPHSLTLPALHGADLGNSIGMIYGPADFDRLRGLVSIPHTTFNVGYIGTVDFIKMHPHYVTMSAAVNVPNLRMIVCGRGGLNDDDLHSLRRQAYELHKSEQFDFRGYIEDICPVIGLFDIYGYPLCEDTYACSEANLQEVMFAGIPPVVFPYGGITHLVNNGETGLVVNTEYEYTQAIEYLYHHPEEIQRLGANARIHAQRYFGAENTGKQMNSIYETMMQKPKRKRRWATETLYQTYRQTHAAIHRPDSAAAEMFVDALGPSGTPYLISLYDRDLEKVLAAEKLVAASSCSVLMRSPVCGSVFHYRKWYPQDSYLRLWAGLLLWYQQRYQEAIEEFTQAIQLGFTHWRVYWYQAQVAEAMNDPEQAVKALEILFLHAPDFLPARQQLQQIKSLSA